MFRFPTNAARRQLWVEFVENNGAVLRPSSKLCSKHFVPGVDYIRGIGVRRLLFSTAVPSIFDGKLLIIFIMYKMIELCNTIYTSSSTIISLPISHEVDIYMYIFQIYKH